MLVNDFKLDDGSVNAAMTIGAQAFKRSLGLCKEIANRSQQRGRLLFCLLHHPFRPFIHTPFFLCLLGIILRHAYRPFDS